VNITVSAAHPEAAAVADPAEEVAAYKRLVVEVVGPGRPA